MLVVSLLLIRDALHVHQAWVSTTILVLVGMLSLSAMIGLLRMRGLRAGGSPGAPHAALMASTTLVVFLAAASGFLLAIAASR